MLREIPTFSICSLDAAKSPSNDLAFYQLREFLNVNKKLVFPHRHSFYQVLYITHGGGTHIIDFKAYPVEKGTMFFLAPGQIHEWLFDDETEGVLINFSEAFFSNFLANRHYTRDFTFFIGNGAHSVVDVKDETTFITATLNNVSSEYDQHELSRFDVIRVLLLHLFIVLNRKITTTAIAPGDQNYQAQIRNFELKIEEYYLTKRLPKDYAAMLFITPNHLNAVCKQIKGIPAGKLIRDRVLLEAKRLLVNSDKNISEISNLLNFENNSYFSRFFKQYEGLTPEEFKKNYRTPLSSVKSVIDSVKR